MADGRWDMGSWGSATCEGAYVCGRESDGSPFLQEAEAPGTDQGASQDSVQSSTPMGEIHQDLHDTIQKLNSKLGKHYAQMVAWLQEDKQQNEVVLKGLGENGWVPTGPGVGGSEKGGSGLRDSDPSFSQVLHQEIKQLEEALEQEEICQQQRKKEAEAPGTVLPEVVEAQLERDMLARRRGFIYWLQTLCLLLVGLQLAVGFALAAAVLYASWYDPELFYRLLLRVLCEETYAHLAYALGEILPVVSEGLLPF
ncbi:uncharacterized protein LOC142073628 [Calonectris borealis]|uniref:uncharacterized protein LOC142073628 n=1 Tax=Calonectris borealis TaxID=1323832 RepID=UPI003F4C0EDF